MLKIKDIFYAPNLAHIFVDALFVLVAIVLAYLIRFEFDINMVIQYGLLVYAPFILFIQLILNYFFQAYNILWRYFALFDAAKLAIGISLTALILVIFDFSMPLRFIPLGVIGNYVFITFVMLAAVRILKKQLSHKPSVRKERADTMIVGAGQAGLIVLNEMKTHRERPYNPVVFIDDDLSKVGKRINGILIGGTIADIPRCIEEYHIKEVIIAIPSLNNEKLEDIIKLVSGSGIYPKILPNIESRFDVKPVELEDLLNRSVREFDASRLNPVYNNKVVLVTGAGGSIGSEIVRQVLNIGCREIVLIGHGENSLYSIEREINGKYDGKVNVSVIVADIQDRARLDRIFEKYKPNIVLHAAAHKHVPMMEANPSEAIKNNVAGTRNVAELAVKYGVERFVLVSTDKAVNPTNVMGATKRCAEVLIQSMAQKQDKTIFCAVRFGNVLGSRGSVIPVFREQIEKGGPITVTHPEITRFFMTIPEATRLILQASGFAKGGEVFVLDMGEPIKIIDIAKKLISLSGKNNIEIVYTGLRPGEKLYEELLTAEEGVTKTDMDKIFVAKPAEIDPSIEKKINELIRTAVDEDKPAMDNLIHQIVPTYAGNIK